MAAVITTLAPRCCPQLWSRSGGRRREPSRCRWGRRRGASRCRWGRRRGPGRCNCEACLRRRAHRRSSMIQIVYKLVILLMQIALPDTSAFCATLSSSMKRSQWQCVQWCVISLIFRAEHWRCCEKIANYTTSDVVCSDLLLLCSAVGIFCSLFVLDHFLFLFLPCVGCVGLGSSIGLSEWFHYFEPSCALLTRYNNNNKIIFWWATPTTIIIKMIIIMLILLYNKPLKIKDWLKVFIFFAAIIIIIW